MIRESPIRAVGAVPATTAPLRPSPPTRERRWLAVVSLLLAGITGVSGWLAYSAATVPFPPTPEPPPGSLVVFFDRPNLHVVIDAWVDRGGLISIRASSTDGKSGHFLVVATGAGLLNDAGYWTSSPYGVSQVRAFRRRDVVSQQWSPFGGTAVGSNEFSLTGLAKTDLQTDQAYYLPEGVFGGPVPTAVIGNLKASFLMSSRTAEVGSLPLIGSPGTGAHVQAHGVPYYESAITRSR